MPPFFRRKRRRGPPGPSKNEKKVLRSQEAQRLTRLAGLINEKFPFLQHLTLELDFITPQQHPLEQQTLVFNPTDTHDFMVPCPGRCAGKGSFDLTDKINSAIQNRQTSAQENEICNEPIDDESPDLCGFQLRCNMKASYLPQHD